MSRSRSGSLSLEEAKEKFCNFLGSENKEGLTGILTESFEGDNFRDNIRAVFGNFFYDLDHKERKQTRDSDEENSEDDEEIADHKGFTNKFLAWGGQEIDAAFNVRWRVAGMTTIGLFGCFGLNFINPVAGMVTGICLNLAAGTAEGVAKRNIANFCHLEEHLTQKIRACLIIMIKEASKLDGLSEPAKAKLRKLNNPKNKSKESAVARYSSYFSGPVVSGVNNLLSRFAGISPVISGIIGAFFPFLPLTAVSLSKISTNLRHKTALAVDGFFHKVIDIIFDPNSWTIDESEAALKLQQITKNFSQNFAVSDSHGHLPNQRKYHKAKAGSKDKKSNPSKWITFPTWIAAKTNKFLTKTFLKEDVRDIADMPEYFDDEEKMETKEDKKEEKEDKKERERKISIKDDSTKLSDPLVIKTDPTKRTVFNKLLQDFEKLSAVKIAEDKSKRDDQIKEQNQIINNILNQSIQFNLISTTPNLKQHTTTFVYADPYRPHDTNKRVTYIRNDYNGKINVRYEAQTHALLIEKPTEQTNGCITEINQKVVTHYGNLGADNNFQSFTESKSPSPSPAKTMAQKFNKSTSCRFESSFDDRQIRRGDLLNYPE